MSFDISILPNGNNNGLWFIWDNARILLIRQQLPNTPPDVPLTGYRFIGLADGIACHSAELIGPGPADAEWQGMRALLPLLTPAQQQALSRARQFRLFDREHRFCSACAHPLETHHHDHGKYCPGCGQPAYPRLSPAMMVCIVRDRQILLARAPHFAPGIYSALAGFVEPGETLEQCVHRETMEEVGIRIHNLRYRQSQSWPFPHSLMLAFIAHYQSGEITPQAGEIEDAQWFDIDALPSLPLKASIAHWLIHDAMSQIRAESAPGQEPAPTGNNHA